MKEIVCPKVCTPTRCTPGGGLMCFCFMIFAAKIKENIRPPLPCATSWLHTVSVTHPSRAFYYAIPAGAAVSAKYATLYVIWTHVQRSNPYQMFTKGS